MGSGGVAIAALPTVICLKVPFSDGLGGGNVYATNYKNAISNRCYNYPLCLVRHFMNKP